MDVLWGRRGTAINHISVLSAAATPEYWKWLRQRRVPIFLLISRLSLIWSISRTVWFSYSLASSYPLRFFFRCCFSCCCGWRNPPGLGMLYWVLRCWCKCIPVWICLLWYSRPLLSLPIFSSALFPLFDPALQMFRTWPCNYPQRLHRRVFVLLQGKRPWSLLLFIRKLSATRK